MSEYIIDWDTGLVIDAFSKNNLREEIVRCRDCEEFSPYHTHAGDMLDCGMCLKHDCETWKNRFCYWATRKERIEQ